MSFSAATSAWETGRQWEQGSALPRDLRDIDMADDAINFSVAISECVEGVQWLLALVVRWLMWESEKMNLLRVFVLHIMSLYFAHVFVPIMRSKKGFLYRDRRIVLVCPPSESPPLEQYSYGCQVFLVLPSWLFPASK